MKSTVKIVRSNPPREVYIIIGNGFDKEAGLKTSYPEFLKFINAVDLHFKNVISYNEGPKKLLEEYKAIRKERGRIIDLSKWRAIPENFWYQHFKNANIQKGWIDFENEIACVIHLFEEELKSTESVDRLMLCNQRSRFYAEIFRPLEEKARFSSNDAPRGGNREFNITYRQFRDKLLDELNELTKAFDYYLQDFVEAKKIKPTDTILDLFDKVEGAQHCRVLSFNYTSTFERLMSMAHSELEVDYCHVHGRVGKDENIGNLVLGIDEKYNSESDVSVLLAPFKKYYQRVYKETDSNYADWLQEANNNSQYSRELYIFGHSIGITDKDILKAFITSPNMKTVVYSHNDKARADQIANMTEIIGINDLVLKNSGSERTLEFKRQNGPPGS